MTADSEPVELLCIFWDSGCLPSCDALINNQIWSLWSIYWSLWKQHLKTGLPSFSLLWRVQMITIDLPPERIKSKPEGEKNSHYYRTRITVAMVQMLVRFSSHIHCATRCSFPYKCERTQEQCGIIFSRNIMYADLEIHAY